MELPTYLLFAMGLLGATDILVFHSVAHGIRQHRESRWELVTHSLRGPTYAALFVLVPNCALHGGWFLALTALLAFDLAISLWDFALEGQSRRLLGGLPTGEYILHILLAMLFGALATSIIAGRSEWLDLPTAIAYAPANVPDALRLIMAAMALLVFLSGLQDAIAAVRLSGSAAANSGPKFRDVI